MYIHVYVYVYVYIHICMYVCMYVYRYTYIYIYIYIGVPCRQYHALLNAASSPPVGRVATVNSVEETV